MSTTFPPLPKEYIQLGYVPLVFLIYLLCLGIYRLFLSPIAHFPGSKLTAITGWYETYLDVYKGGQFTFQIEKWHQRYALIEGPIIRVNPWEIHIADPDFYDMLYSFKNKFDKVEHWKYRFGVPLATVDTIPHDHHHRRRAAIGPFFSRQRILDYSPYIQSRVDKLCRRLTDEYSGTSKVVCLNDAWASMASDVINYYLFGFSYNFQDYPDFVAPFTTSIKHLAYSVHLMGHFPWFLSVLQSVPDAIVGILNPAMRPVFKFHAEISALIRKVLKEEEKPNDKRDSHKTVINELLQSDLPKEELSHERLRQEASSITGAAIETTKSTLSLASFHIINNPEIYHRLHEELVQAMPDLSAKPLTVPELEKLPYLNAVVQESLRLFYGVTQRLTRTSPHHPIHYHTYTIPPGTPFGMTSYLQHRSPTLFPSPSTFSPDRWLNNPVVASTNKPLSRYLVSFSKGPRMCVGINLANAELFIGLATVFRRLEFGLWETGRGDVEMAADYFVPMPERGSKGVRVFVK